jgi:signal transduction histidine kinase
MRFNQTFNDNAKLNTTYIAEKAAIFTHESFSENSFVLEENHIKLLKEYANSSSDNFEFHLYDTESYIFDNLLKIEDAINYIIFPITLRNHQIPSVLGIFASNKKVTDIKHHLKAFEEVFDTFKKKHLDVKQLINSKKAILFPLIQKIQASCKSQENERAEKFKEQLDQLNRKLSSGFAITEQKIVEDALIQTVREITGAAGGALWHQSRDNPDEFIATSYFGELTPEYKAMKLHRSNKASLVVRCWQTKQIYSEPDWLNSQSLQLLKEHNIKESFPTISESTQQFLEKKIRCRLVLPIQMGDKVIAILSLYGLKPYLFDNTCILQVKELTKRAQWFLYALYLTSQHENMRHQWERAVMHEIRSYSNIIGQRIEQAEAFPNSSKNSLIEASRVNQELLDLTDNFMDVDTILGKYEMNKHHSFQQLGDPIFEFIKRNEKKLHQNQQQIIINPEKPDDLIWQTPLICHESIFERVVRNLLHNAIKYSEINATITVQANCEGRYWVLRISNQGQMTEEENRLKFVPRAHLSNQKKDGAHVGLAASLALVHELGGKLSVNNGKNELGHPCVITELRWLLK